MIITHPYPSLSTKGGSASDGDKEGKNILIFNLPKSLFNWKDLKC